LFVCRTIRSTIWGVKNSLKMSPGVAALAASEDKAWPE
jgi:hypothetical protein